MAQLTADTMRDYVNGDYEDLSVDSAVVIYKGSAVGLNSGNARQLVAGDPFAGFAEEKADNSAGAAGAITVRTKSKGKIVLTVAGSPEINAAVYASDGATFTTAATSNTLIGYIKSASGNNWVVYFDSTLVLQ